VGSGQVLQAVNPIFFISSISACV